MGAAALALLGGVATVLGTLPSQAVDPAAATANTVRVDLSASRGTMPFGPGRDLSATPNSWKYGEATDTKLSDLDLDKARVWLEFDQAYDVDTHTPRYDKWYDYLDEYASRSRALVVNWRSDYHPLVDDGTFSAAELLSAETAMLADYKRHNPTITYLESENEALMTADDADPYYQEYQFAYTMVNAVNAMDLPGPKIKVGGPVTDIFTTWRIGMFLDRYEADTNSGKRLDFISYHQYLIDTTDGEPWDTDKKNPARVKSERQQLDDMLADHGLSSRPVLVTETGLFPHDRKTDLGLSADYHIQAAGMAALQYWYLDESGVTPFDWTVHHPDNDRKSLFADTDTGLARPYYNSMRMRSMVPRTRYRATSNTLSAKGIGVYGLAGATADSVAVMTWNYQWTGQTSYDSKLVISHFPAAFATDNMMVTRYRIANDSDTGTLDPVERFVVKPRGTDGGYTSQAYPLRPNELRLMVLTPTTLPVGWHS